MSDNLKTVQITNMSVSHEARNAVLREVGIKAKFVIQRADLVETIGALWDIALAEGLIGKVNDEMHLPLVCYMNSVRDMKLAAAEEEIERLRGLVNEGSK